MLALHDCHLLLHLLLGFLLLLGCHLELSLCHGWHLMWLRYGIVEIVLDDDTGFLALEALKSLLSCISRKELIELLISYCPIHLKDDTYQVLLLWLELTSVFPLV